ncbi:hypothetical protein [Deinococcus soli (ex Cha et al. 2016)]|uniref:Lipoprotein n=2 Tax=Deinococcus soli (ex Cha et al. 2016) TaxID=1309411 RepID=A0AAE3XEC5_9DEIO|nr:hypothetical protein [Deinococcus soli (ex Cha et al. 2016)]MDR6219852.1 hypothetical protein [Deinococcus soli (ex Cha et al. 2016)]MDR6329890.1 hypothetical protein [Deinococcus soli (ex Cha et al. 2016)]MDR6752759.1 hypothetical protein [Deinococcus soli (ex Cha et al. 2016)]
MKKRLSLVICCLILGLSSCRDSTQQQATESEAPLETVQDPPRTAPLAEQPADLIREECLNDLRGKVEAPNASYDPANLPQFAGGRWTWNSEVGEFTGGAEVQRSFKCVVSGATMASAVISTTLP